MTRRIPVAAGRVAVVAVVLGVCASVWVWPELASRIGATLVGVSLVGTLYQVRRHNGRVMRRVGAIESLMRHQHKRASEWDWRLNERLTRAGLASPATVSGEVVASPSGGDGLWKSSPHRARLHAMGILDVAFYRELTGIEFGDDLTAADHWLSVGMKQLLPPSPFIDTEMLPEDVRTGMRFGRAADVLEFFDSERAHVRLGPAFDARHVVSGGATSRGLLPLAGFHGNIDGSVKVPVSLDDPRHQTSAREYRAELARLAREVRAADALSGSRESETWDHEREAVWRQTLADVATADLLVSIILPVRDRADMVGAAVDSVRRQSHRRWRLVAIDDGSKDGTGTVLRAAAAEDSRIVVVEGAGQGVAAARNLGLLHAVGDYVAFLDSDNTWRPEFLETMLRGMLTRGARSAHAGMRVEQSDELTTYRAFDGGRDHLRLLNHIDLNVLVLERQLAVDVGGFDTSIRRWVDHDFALRVAAVSDIPLFPFVGCDYNHDRDRHDRITTRESEHWQWVVLGKEWVDRAQGRPTEVAGRISVVIPTYNDAAMTIRCVESLRAWVGDLDIEVIVVDNGSRPDISRRLSQHLVGVPRTHYRRLPRNFNFAIGCNVGARIASGQYLFFLNNDAFPRAGNITDLVQLLETSGALGVQPTLVYEDDRIQTAGTVFVAPRSVPVHLMTGHPWSDAEQIEGVELRAATAAAMLVRAEEFWSVSGFDPLFVNGMEDVDLCLRMTRRFAGRGFRVSADVTLVHLESQTPGRTANQTENRRLFLQRWGAALRSIDTRVLESCGFEVSSIGHDGSEVPAPVVELRRTAEQRRWGIKIASVPGIRGDTWGDTYFADSLREGLVRAGQDAGVYRHGTHETRATRFDDVNLVIRGLDRCRPLPGQVNVLWIISHPDMVSLEELREFDVVCVASEHWAARMRAETGIDVQVLLQATAVRAFIEPIPEMALSDAVVFVGGVHAGRERQGVIDAVAAGVKLRVYGPGWEDRLPEGVLVGQGVPNDRLCEVYASAGHVLADHWRDMAQNGFVQNRVFDAVASGARVLSDPVPGIESLFHGAVVTYDGPEELADIVARGNKMFPSDSEMREIARRVREEHSFEVRARQLVAIVDSFLEREAQGEGGE